MKKQKLAISAVLFWCILAVSGAAWCGDNGDGTVTVDGRVWLKDAGCMGQMGWNYAKSRSKSLAHGQCGLTDKSKPGDWRLPALDELAAIYSAKGQFNAVKAYYYWSTYSGNTNYAWSVHMGSGSPLNGYKGCNHYVWPVRAVK